MIRILSFSQRKLQQQATAKATTVKLLKFSHTFAELNFNFNLFAKLTYFIKCKKNAKKV